MPEGETNRLSVAVKVLNEGTGAAASKELLQEAVTMSSIDHPHLVRLLCVCMASRVMLITQLVPLGAMLSYLRKRKSTLTGEALLVFSYQVARVWSAALIFVRILLLLYAVFRAWSILNRSGWFIATWQLEMFWVNSLSYVIWLLDFSYSVQTPMMVKISDFGLSKILDIDEGHFQSLGEKVSN